VHKSPLFWAFIASVVVFAAFCFGYYLQNGKFDAYSGVAPAATAFGVILNGILMFELFNYKEDELGKLSGQRTTIVLGIIFTLFFGTIQILTSLDSVF